MCKDTFGFRRCAFQFSVFVLLILVFDGLQPQRWTAMISVWEEAGSRGDAAPLSTTKSTRSKATSLWPNSSDSRHSVPFAATSSGNDSRRQRPLVSRWIILPFIPFVSLSQGIRKAGLSMSE